MSDAVSGRGQAHTGAPRPPRHDAPPPAPPSGSDRGWGRPKGPTREEHALRLADRLAARVRAWEQHPSMNNHWAMLEALEEYEKTLR